MSTAALLHRGQNDAVSEDNPAARPRRRSFSAEYKLGILAEYEALSDSGAKGALLGGRASTPPTSWSGARAPDAGAMKELGPRSRPVSRTPEQVALERANRKIEALEETLAKHRLALEIQGKASEPLGRLLAESDEDHRRQP
jgi:transposase-like protein